MRSGGRQALGASRVPLGALRAQTDLILLLPSSKLLSSKLLSSKLVSSKLVSSKLVSSKLLPSKLLSSKLLSSPPSFLCFDVSSERWGPSCVATRVRALGFGWTRKRPTWWGARRPRPLQCTWGRAISREGGGLPGEVLSPTSGPAPAPGPAALRWRRRRAGGALAEAGGSLRPGGPGREAGRKRRKGSSLPEEGCRRHLDIECQSRLDKLSSRQLEFLSASLTSLSPLSPFSVWGEGLRRETEKGASQTLRPVKG